MTHYSVLLTFMFHVQEELKQQHKNEIQMLEVNNKKSALTCDVIMCAGGNKIIIKEACSFCLCQIHLTGSVLDILCKYCTCTVLVELKNREPPC